MATKAELVAEWRDMAQHCRTYAVFVGNAKVQNEHEVMAGEYERLAEELEANAERWNVELQRRFKNKLSEALHGHND